MVSDNKTKDRDGSQMPEEREMIEAIRAQIKPRPPLTDEERTRALEALADLGRMRAESLAARGGKLYPNSWEEFPNLYESDDEDYKPREEQ
jgi:hypothetical protein